MLRVFCYLVNMNMKQINPKTGIKTLYITDDRGNITEVREQGTQATMDHIQAVKNDGNNGFNKDRSRRFLGSMPVVIYQELMDRARGYYPGITDPNWIHNPVDQDKFEKSVRAWFAENNRFSMGGW